MALQLGVIQYRGKLGQTVGAKKASWQRANVMRARVAPANPKTRAQAEQRMKMAAATKLAAVLDPVVTRSFQNVAYGKKSRDHFIRLLTHADVPGVESNVLLPYIPKDNAYAVPGFFPVSFGSLSYDCSILFRDERAEVALFSRSLAKNTLGEIFADLGLEDGDQITIVAAFDVFDDNMSFVWKIGSKIVDLSDTTPAPDGYACFETDNGALRIGDAGAGTITEAVDDMNPVAAAVIISRERGSVPGYRTCSNMSCVSTFMTTWMDSVQKEASLATYMNASAKGTDWPVQQVDPTYLVTVVLDPSEGGTVTGGGKVKVGNNVTLVATANSGFTFQGWYMNNERVSQAATFSFKPTKNVTIGARFFSSEQP